MYTPINETKLIRKFAAIGGNKFIDYNKLTDELLLHYMKLVYRARCCFIEQTDVDKMFTRELVGVVDNNTRIGKIKENTDYSMNKSKVKDVLKLLK